MADPIAAEPVVTARALTLRGPHGAVYGPVDLDIDSSGVTVLVGPAGLASTALLLTLAGRMRQASGQLTVCGRTRATEIFGRAAVAGFDDIDDLTADVTVGDLLAERLRWKAPWHSIVRRVGVDDLVRVCGPVFGELPLPGLARYSDELSELDALLLRIALANIDRPPLLVIGMLEQITDTAQRDVLVERLIDLGSGQTVITASVNGVAGHPVAHVRLGVGVGV